MVFVVPFRDTVAVLSTHFQLTVLLISFMLLLATFVRLFIIIINLLEMYLSDIIKLEYKLLSCVCNDCNYDQLYRYRYFTYSEIH
jgi:hypothetical protein